MGFFDADRWSEIWQTISRNRKRSIMTALGIFWGIFMLTVLLGAGMGLGRMMQSQLGGLSTNAVFMNPGRTSVPYKGMPTGRWWQLNNEDVEALRKLPEIKNITGVSWLGQHKASNDQRKGDYSAMGYSPDNQNINPQIILFGRYINNVDMVRRRKVCVIGTQVYNELFPGGEDPSGKTIKINGAYFTVVGVIARQGKMFTFSDIERTIIFPLTLAQQMFRQGNMVHMIAVAGINGTNPKHIEKICRNELFSRHLISPDDQKAIWMMSPSDFLDKINGLFSGITLLTWIVGLGTLLAGVVGVSNIMLVLVKERTQEIGIRRALGAPPLAIISQILSESFVLTFVAGVMGLALAVGLLSLVDSIYYQNITVAKDGVMVSWQISFSVGMISLLILVVGSLLAGIIPATRALSIKAVDAIREE